MNNHENAIIYHQITSDTRYIILSNEKEFVIYDSLTFNELRRTREFGGIRFLSGFNNMNVFMVVPSGDGVGKCFL